MGAQERAAEEQLANEIAIAHRVDAVARQGSEAEAALEQHAGDREGAPGHRAGAERQLRGCLTRVLEARAVAIERPEVRQHPVGRGDGLRPLEMRVRRHDGAIERGGLVEHDELERADQGVELRRGVHRPHARGGRDLIVATPPGVQLGGDVADFGVEQAIDERMDVLVRRGRGFTRGQSRGHAVEPVLEALALLEREDAGVPERHGPGLGGADVERPEPDVDVDGAIELVEGGGRAGGEAAAPQAVRRGRARRGRRRIVRHGHTSASTGSAGSATGAATPVGRDAASRALSAFTRSASPKRRMKPAASRCS